MIPLINRELDLRGLSEPLSLLSTRRVIDELHNGDVLLVTTSDHTTLEDIDSLCRQTGNLLLQSSEQGEEHTFLICKHSELHQGRKTAACISAATRAEI